MIGSKVEAMKKISDATDRTGGAKFPKILLPSMRGWEREGLIELHVMNDPDSPIARITKKGRAFAKKAMA
jgi:hypothetical protein